MPVEVPQNSLKALVIGSDRHQHVTSVGWEQVQQVNVVDFEAVVINPCSLTNDLIRSQEKIWKRLRTDLSRLLLSGARLIVIAEKFRISRQGDLEQLDNYCWSPFSISVTNEKGTSLKWVESEFPKYLSRLRSWDCYYLPVAVRTEFIDLVSHPDIRVNITPYLTNREGKVLAGECYALTVQSNGLTSELCRKFVLMPEIAELEQHAAVNLILEDLIGLPQTTLPPTWVADIQMPGLAELTSEIDRKAAAIREIQSEIASLEEKRHALEEYRKLVYASGHELEEIFARCLRECGGTVKPAQYSQEEFVLEYKGNTYLIECKGVGKSIGLTDARQLLNHKLDYEEQTGQPGKGYCLEMLGEMMP